MPPPMVARSAVEGSMGNCRPCSRAAALSEVSTTPGCTRALRAPGSMESTRSM